MKIKYIFLLFLASTMLISCKHKNKPKKDNKNDVKTEIVKNQSVQQTASQLNEAKKMLEYKDDFKTLEIQFDIKLESPQRNLGASGTMRIANDSCMWLYVKALGFEVARAKFTKDSVLAVVKLKNQYFKGDYSSIQKFLPVACDFGILQSIFVNQIYIMPNNREEDLSNYNMEDTENGLKLFTNGNSDFLNRYTFHDEMEIIRNNNKMSFRKILYPKNNVTATIKFADFAEIQGHNIPKNLVIESNDMKVTFNYKKIVYEKSLSFPLSIPDSYKPLQF